MNGAAGADHHMNNNNNSLNNNNSGVNNNNNSSSLNNNHAVKSERLSPGRAALTPDNQSSASRLVDRDHLIFLKQDFAYNGLRHIFS